MDIGTDKQTYGWKNAKKDRWKDRQTERQIEGQIEEQMDRLMEYQTAKQMKILRTDKQTDVLMHW